MDFPQDQIDELKKIAPQISISEEGGYTYIMIENLKLPEGCKPSEVNALLCPALKDGYQSSMFFAQKIDCSAQKDWKRNIRVLGTNWYALSWQTLSGLRLAEMLMIHLKPFRKQ